MKNKTLTQRRKGVEGARPEIHNTPAMMSVFQLISKHRLHQRYSASEMFLRMDHPVPGDSRKLRRLLQAFGQVADAIEGKEQEECTNSREELRYALLTLAAHTVAWLECLEVTT